MEVKSINTNTKILKADTAPKDFISFGKNEKVTANIIAIDGDSATLETRDGQTFTAQLITDLMLSVGDDLQLIYKGRQDGRPVMQAITVNQDFVEITPETGVRTNNQGHEAQIIRTLGNMNIEPTQEMLGEIENILRQNPEAGIKTAVFMYANRIPVTQENIDILNQFEAGGNLIADNLSEVAGQVVADAVLPQNINAQEVLDILNGAQQNGGQTEDAANHLRAAMPQNVSVSQNKEFYSVSLPVSLPDIENQTQAQTPLSTEAAAVVEQGGEQMAASAGAVTENASRTEGKASPEVIHASEQIKVLVDDIFKNGVPEKAQYIHGAQSPKGEAAHQTQSAQNINQEGNLAETGMDNLLLDKSAGEVLAKITSLFTNIDDLKNGETNIKKEVQEQNGRIFELKEKIKSADIKNRDVVASKLDKTISENKLLSDIERFNLYHVPVNTGTDRQTAEIYIYKRNRQKSAEAQQEIKILIGLDTQNLGRFEVLVTAKSKNLSLKIRREEDTANEAVGLRMKRLEETFSELGYTLSDISIEKLLEKTTPVNAEEILSGNVGTSAAKIDYTV